MFFSHTFFWWWWLGEGGVQRYYRIFFCTRCRHRCEGKRDMELLIQRSVFGAFHSSNTQQRLWHQSTSDASVGFIVDASLSHPRCVSAVHREEAQFVAPCGISLTIDPTVAQTWRWNFSVRIVNNSGVCATTVWSDLYSTFTSQANEISTDFI